MQAQALNFNFRHLAGALLALLAVPVLFAQEDDAKYSRENYDNAMISGLYDEAEVTAKARLDEAVRAGHAKALSTAELLDDLAEAQRQKGDFNAALQNFELAIDIVETEKDMLDLALTQPLLGISNTYIDSGRSDLALEHLDRALHVRSVNEGPHSIEQAATLEVLAHAYQSMGKPKKATDVADRLYLLYRRNFSENSLELVPVLLKKGHILGDIGEWRLQRNAYNAALDIVEKAEGKLSANSIRPLISLGSSHANEYFKLFFKAKTEEKMPDKHLLVEAETYFRSAFDLGGDVAAEDWRVTQEAIIALGDFHMMISEPSQARLLYRTAWNFLSTDEERRMQRTRNLEHVVPLLQPNPDLTVALPFHEQDDASSPKYETGFIVSQYTVTRHGDLTTISLVEIVPERNDKIEAEVKSALTQFVYRPRFDRGVAVDTTGQVIRYEFPYRESPAAAN